MIVANLGRQILSDGYTYALSRRSGGVTMKEDLKLKVIPYGPPDLDLTWYFMIRA